MINWKVRIKNKAFWVAIIPAVLLLAQQICSLFGFEINVSGLGEQLVSIAGTIFAVLALLGVVNDPTTKGIIADSEQAMTYEKPKGAG
jgi:phi LC3 family holin